MRLGTKSLATAAVLFLAAALAHADSPGDVWPKVPCDGGGEGAAYASAEPTVRTWTDLEWEVPTCLGWPRERYKFVIAAAGRIEAADDATLRRRIGAVSSTKGLRYWSVSEGAWRVLIKDAAALSAPEGARREDFPADEIRPGAVLYFMEEDNRSSNPVVYKMRILEAARDRIVVETENITPIKSFLVTLFPPGSLRAAYFMSRLEGNSWGLYAVSAASGEASEMIKFAKASYINRARAFYGHFAGATQTTSSPSP
jgi:hypothetical protein